MTVNGPVASRQFSAHPPAWGSKFSSPDQSKMITRLFIYGMVALTVLPVLVAIPFLAFTDSVTALQWGGGTLLFVVMGGAVVFTLAWPSYLARHRSRRILLCVTNGALTVDTRPGVAFSFSSAKLGTWGTTGGITMGTALHLQSGMDRFILGGRDHRLSAGTRLGAPDAGYGLPVDIDVWVSASEFDEILDITGLRSRLDVRPSAPGTPIRCLLFTNPQLASTMGLSAVFKMTEFRNSLDQPLLAIEVGAEAIWTVDPSSNAFIASVWRAEVTATPITFRRVLASGDGAITLIAPQIVVSGPSLAPLTIACVDGEMSGIRSVAPRFSWRGDVPVVRDPADYAVWGADWLTLVETFGLAPYMEERV
jgi:hypothetical protein